MSSSLELLTVPMGKQKRLSPAVTVPSCDTAGEQKPDFPRAPLIRSILMASGTELKYRTKDRKLKELGLILGFSPFGSKFGFAARPIVDNRVRLLT